MISTRVALLIAPTQLYSLSFYTIGGISLLVILGAALVGIKKFRAK